jgi:16S rRNA (cytosine1402-N4)-methyltransferase
MEDSIFHKPVMADEIIEFLCLKKSYKILDATVGCGGHAGLILEKIHPQGFLIGIDRDRGSLAVAEEGLKRFGKSYKLVYANFSDIDKVLESVTADGIDGALFDLGLSSYQLEDARRGFSFMKDGSLDMRMDPTQGLRAFDIVNRRPGSELERIIRDFGEERYFRRITGAILERRKKAAIKSTEELSGLIARALGGRHRSRRIHPATRTFQALRIAVNDELNCLNEGLVKAARFLRPGGRMCVISFHSLEDRIVKRRFKEFAKDGRGGIITKKPLTPGEDEIRGNPRSRSAKLRVFEGK